MEAKAKASRERKLTEPLRLVAEILASAIVRRRLRDVHNSLKKNRKSEKGLEVSFGQSVHPVEPQRGRTT